MSKVSLCTDNENSNLIFTGCISNNDDSQNNSNKINIFEYIFTKFLKRYGSILTKALLYMVMMFLIIFIWEYVAIKADMSNKPSYYICIVRDNILYLSEDIGIIFAYISSYLDIINLQDLAQAFTNIFMPIWEICAEFPIYFKKGYMSITVLYDHPYIIILGSVLLVFNIIFGGGLYIYKHHIKVKND